MTGKPTTIPECMAMADLIVELWVGGRRDEIRPVLSRLPSTDYVSLVLGASMTAFRQKGVSEDERFKFAEQVVNPYLRLQGAHTYTKEDLRDLDERFGLARPIKTIH